MTDLLEEVLAPYSDDFDDAADRADDPGVAATCRALAALGRGEDPPTTAAQRIKRQAEEERQ